MSDEPGVQFMGARSKRTQQRSPMSQDTEDGQNDPWNAHIHPPSPQRTSTSTDFLSPIRTAGDGFDYRRPANTASQAADQSNVIDLTNDESPPQRNRRPSLHRRPQNLPRTRLPRFERDILDGTPEVVNLDDDDNDDNGEGPSSSPEVLFVGESVRPRPSHLHRFNPMSLFADLPHLPRPSASNIAMLTRAHRHRGWHGPNRPPNMTNHNLETLIIGEPGELHLDYGVASFAMGTSSRPEPRQRDTYKAPSPAPPGFTRTLADDDMAVCPHCDWELGTGDGKKQEIWVAKPCGHVYCGECAENRHKSKAKNKKAAGTQHQRIEPFSKCQVEGCNKSVSAPTAMFHLFL